MIRSRLIPVLAAIASLGLAAPALAQSADDSAGPSVQVKTADLATMTGRAQVRLQLEAAAGAWCRSHPGQATTVYDCQRQLTAQLAQGLETRTGVALESHGATRLASQ
jgi:UrcA family protein